MSKKQGIDAAMDDAPRFQGIGVARDAEIVPPTKPRSQKTAQKKVHKKATGRGNKRDARGKAPKKKKKATKKKPQEQAPRTKFTMPDPWRRFLEVHPEATYLLERFLLSMFLGAEWPVDSFDSVDAGHERTAQSDWRIEALHFYARLTDLVFRATQVEDETASESQVGQRARRKENLDKLLVACREPL